MRIFHIALAFSLLVAGNAIAQDQPVDQQIDDALGDHTKFRPVIEGYRRRSPVMTRKPYPSSLVIPSR